jgi:hypothetical protein
MHVTTGTEISYQMPFSGAEGFPGLFDELDHKSKQLGIASYGISVTTLEEVFLRVGMLLHSLTYTAAYVVSMVTKFT